MSVIANTAAIAAATLAIAWGAGQFISTSLHTEIEIDAPASAVWAELSNTSAFPEWNPFVRSIEGGLNVGERLEVTIRPDGRSPMTFKPEVLVSDQDRELRWIGRLGFKGVFDGEHYFIVEEGEDGKTRFRHGEIFSGMLSYPLFVLIETDTRKGFEAMNAALKARVEAKN